MGAGSVSFAAPLGEWWNAAWPYRYVVEVVTPDPSRSINTARAIVDTEAKCAKGGRDIRITDEAGKELKHHVLSETDGIVRLEFLVPAGASAEATRDARATRYFIYYGNRQAPPRQYTWERKLGGLLLVTWSNTLKRNAQNLEHMRKLLANSRWKFGDGSRAQINDSENPFGPDDQYLSVYTGRLFCPRTGTYTFATNSDDASFLLIDGQLVAEWTGGHNPSSDWDHFGKIDLNKGIHKIEYYHCETLGGQLARAGWQRPGEKWFSIIPREAFLRELGTAVVARQSRVKPLNTIFEYEETDALQFGNMERRFVAVQFTSHAWSEFGEIAMYEWDFGDGCTSRDASPSHEYMQAKRYRVTLTCRDRLGFSDTCARTITLGRRGVRRVSLFMDVHTDASVLKPGEAASVEARLKGGGRDPQPVTLVREVREGDLLVDSRKERVTLDAKTWLKRTQPVSEVVSSGEVVFRIEYRGVPLLTRGVRILPADGRGGVLKVRGTGLANEDGERVVLRLRGFVSAPPRPSFHDKLAAGGKVQIVVIDDSAEGDASAATGARPYEQILRDRLNARFKNARVTVKRIGASALDTTLPLERVARVPSLVAALKPDLVLVSGSVTDILSYLPPVQYERYLSALVDRVRGLTGADVLLMTPPPLVVNPKLSRGYAVATKRVALRRRLPVANIYSAFTERGEGWKDLYRDPDALDPVYYLCPTAKGQQIIADRVYDRLAGRTWWLERSVSKRP